MFTVVITMLKPTEDSQRAWLTSPGPHEIYWSFVGLSAKWGISLYRHVCLYILLCRLKLPNCHVEVVVVRRHNRGVMLLLLLFSFDIPITIYVIKILQNILTQIFQRGFTFALKMVTVGRMLVSGEQNLSVLTFVTWPRTEWLIAINIALKCLNDFFWLPIYVYFT